jgi:hypothetical protein
MDTDRREHILCALRQPQNPWHVLQSDADAQCMGDAMFAHAGKHSLEVVCKLREVDVAMRVDQHSLQIVPAGADGRERAAS